VPAGTTSSVGTIPAAFCKNSGTQALAPLSLHRVTKRFGDLSVVDDVSVDIADGEFTILVGPSGCGKSTLLRMVAGLDAPSGGEIRIDGRVVNRDAPKVRDIAMVFQNYALYPHMTVAQNMSFGLRMARRSPDEIATRLDQAARMLGLQQLLHRKPRELSGGQRQRVAMGRAIMRDPKVFLFDEPLSNLDAQLRVQMRVEIRELQQRLGTTTIYVTHDQVEAMTMADRIVVMNGGRVEQTGRPLDVYDRPANRFVAGFIGSPSMNFLEGHARRLASGLFFETLTGVLLPLPAADVEDKQPIVYGIRPEHLTLAEHGADAEVSIVESTGHETQMQVRLSDTPLMLLLRDRTRHKPGDRVRIAPLATQAHLFDAESGKRIETAS